MAGLGIKLFQDGAQLSAAEINGYLMDQTVCVFEDETDRNNSFGDTNEPTLSEGRVCYLKSTGKIQFYDGSDWIDSEQFSVSLNEQVSPGILQLDRLVDGTSGQIIVCDSTGTPTYVTLSGDATISNTGVLTIGGNTVTLGTDTTGDYVASLVAGTGVTLTNNSGESATPTIAIGQDIATSASPTFVNMTLTGSASVSGNTSVSGSVSVAGNVVSHAVPETASSLTNAVDGKILKVSGTSSSITLTTTGGSWTNGTQFTVINTNAGALTVAAGSGTTFLAAPLAGSNVKLRAQYSTATFVYESGTGWYVIGDLTSS